MYGAALVIMMLTRPEGLVPEARRRLELHEAEAEAEPREQFELYEAESRPAGLATE
jgi:hypothetical protein